MSIISSVDSTEDVGSHAELEHSVPCVESMTVGTSAARFVPWRRSTEVSVVKHEQEALERVLCRRDQEHLFCAGRLKECLTPL